MSTWAVIRTGGKQYKVEEDQTIVVEKLEGENGSAVAFDNVLLVGGDKIVIGNPIIDKAKVTGKIKETFKDKKVQVVKFKSKSRYTRTNGHRQMKTKVLVEKILI
ncbi:50S ribosomal protein L21 [Candidatus Curtissbacteria bacterium RIFCSPHIGHO2_01_FULL_41_11]|uniref:Large ribosomal subunit protein bL21 n=1 Tax=Candidatus Curtissbacteria bacterium RIFCSPHIGHO2_01_FULL_41_11 TaxID=1797711 RepID=A0A1F5G6W5_9BACT|nr:MAG: 50S ribosomal protein L21 [Candidatus Curtissbacteria bacterium RIFCSPHIGHO2_01_FULL_41_11]